MSEEIARWCGYEDAFEMLIDHSGMLDLPFLLREYIYEYGTALIDDFIEDIASKDYGWVDKERIRADADDAKYEAYRDGEL